MDACTSCSSVTKKRKRGKGRAKQAVGRRQVQPDSSEDEASEIDSDLENYLSSSSEVTSGEDDDE